eukprot:scaffold2153_cov271-Chaetoceros_neogracile.AAC.13
MFQTLSKSHQKTGKELFLELPGEFWAHSCLPVKYGKESRKNTTKSAVSRRSASKNPPILNSVVKTLPDVGIKLSDEENLPMENYFSTHIHSVSSCDGDGAYNIISLFVLNPAIYPNGYPEMSVITVCTVRCHDNIRQTMLVPTDQLRSDDDNGASMRKSCFGTDEIGATCSTCDSVAYCSREHQILHWKKGGHKQQCRKK